MFLVLLTAFIYFFGRGAEAANGYTILANVSYGSDPQQVVDVYLPPTNNSNKWTGISKTYLLIHGGGWSGGKKEDMNGVLWMYPIICPTCAILNMNYRLGTVQSPGYPKQPQDIGLVVGYVKTQANRPNMLFALVGASAGGHLSLLYGFKNPNEVKAIVNIVGPTDLTDPNVAYNAYLNLIINSLVGPYVYCNRPDLYNETSPVKWITPQAPKTISFFGNADPLIPITQSTILKQKLDAAGVTNEMTIYPGGHFDWSSQNMTDMVTKTVSFLQRYF